MEQGIENINKSGAIPNSKKFNLPEITVSEAESQNFNGYVAKVLYEKGEIALAELVEQDKINLKLEAKLAGSTGNDIENFKKSKGEDFSLDELSEHMQKRAEMAANELIKKKNDHLN